MNGSPSRGFGGRGAGGDDQTGTSPTTLPPAGLAAALAALQAELPRIEKTQTANVATQKGKYSYTYAGLSTISAQILPLLSKHGLSFTCKTTYIDGRFVLAYSLLHVSGEREDGQFPLPDDAGPQAVGSAITYGRRYCLCAVTGLAPDDDDDGAAAEAARPAARGATSRRTRTTRPDKAGSWTATQRARIMAAFAKAGITDRADRLDLSSRIVGRHLASANDLSANEADVLLDALDAAAPTDDPAGQLRAAAAGGG